MQKRVDVNKELTTPTRISRRALHCRSPVNKFINIKHPSANQLIYSLKGSVDAQMPSFEESFRNHALIPDVIPAMPKSRLEVVYSENVTTEPGCRFKPKQVRKQPITIKWDAEPSKMYTLIMIDCDAPSRERPSHRDWLHWMIVNIPGDNLNRGVTKADYVGAAPPNGSGFHRYITMIFEQPASLHVNEFGHVRANTSKHRDRFQTKRFLDRYHLGPAPVSATFFEAEFDEVVPEIHAQLKN